MANVIVEVVGIKRGRHKFSIEAYLKNPEIINHWADGAEVLFRDYAHRVKGTLVKDPKMFELPGKFKIAVPVPAEGQIWSGVVDTHDSLLVVTVFGNIPYAVDIQSGKMIQFTKVTNSFFICNTSADFKKVTGFNGPLEFASKNIPLLHLPTQ